jgi:hypothetical protein
MITIKYLTIYFWGRLVTSVQSLVNCPSSNIHCIGRKASGNQSLFRHTWKDHCVHRGGVYSEGMWSLNGKEIRILVYMTLALPLPLLTASENQKSPEQSEISKIEDIILGDSALFMTVDQIVSNFDLPAIGQLSDGELSLEVATVGFDNVLFKVSVNADSRDDARIDWVGLDTEIFAGPDAANAPLVFERLSVRLQELFGEAQEVDQIDFKFSTPEDFTSAPSYYWANESEVLGLVLFIFPYGTSIHIELIDRSKDRGGYSQDLEELIPVFGGKLPVQIVRSQMKIEDHASGNMESYHNGDRSHGDLTRINRREMGTSPKRHGVEDSPSPLSLLRSSGWISICALVCFGVLGWFFFHKVQKVK